MGGRAVAPGGGTHAWPANHDDDLAGGPAPHTPYSPSAKPANRPGGAHQLAQRTAADDAHTTKDLRGSQPPMCKPKRNERECHKHLPSGKHSDSTPLVKTTTVEDDAKVSPEFIWAPGTADLDLL